MSQYRRSSCRVLQVSCLVSSAQAPQPKSAPAYENRCASCHGAAMTGGKGPSILTYVRYHVNKEIEDLVRKGHHGVPADLPDAELQQILAEMRKLAGTNPAMATGGYTGSRGAGPAPASFPPSEPRPDAPGIGSNKPTTIKMADGRSRTGILLGQSLMAATLLENGNTKFTLLSRDGDAYREKPIAPKERLADVRRLAHRQSLQHARSDQQHECSAPRACLVVADARVPTPEHTGRGRRHHVCHRVERADTPSMRPPGGRCGRIRSHAMPASSAKPGLA